MILVVLTMIGMVNLVHLAFLCAGIFLLFHYYLSVRKREA